VDELGRPVRDKRGNLKFEPARDEHGGPLTDEQIRLDRKTGEKIALFPELMTRMDALKRDRVGKGLFFVRDWIDPRAKALVPWAPSSSDISYASRRAKQLIRAAGLDEALSFTSFRHGGMTELGDAELTNAGIRAISRHKSSKVLGRYVKRTHRQIAAGVEKRRALRPAPVAIDTTVQLELFREKGKPR
jgi:hypothetical protein